MFATWSWYIVCTKYLPKMLLKSMHVWRLCGRKLILSRIKQVVSQRSHSLVYIFSKLWLIVTLSKKNLQVINVLIFIKMRGFKNVFSIWLSDINFLIVIRFETLSKRKLHAYIHFAFWRHYHLLIITTTNSIRIDCLKFFNHKEFFLKCS